jgi:hypothetical protein
MDGAIGRGIAGGGEAENIRVSGAGLTEELRGGWGIVGELMEGWV